MKGKLYTKLRLLMIISLNYSYKVKVHCKIAEVMMAKGILKADLILPQVAKESQRNNYTRHKTKHYEKTLNKFMSMDLSLLEQESRYNYHSKLSLCY